MPTRIGTYMKLKTRKEPIPFDPAFIAIVDAQMNKGLHEAERRLKELLISENNYVSQAEEYKQARIREEVKLKDLKTKTEENKGKAEIEAKELFEKLQKHAGVLTLKAENDGNALYIAITTPLLFVDIREEEGSRKMNRACIGQFEVNLYPTYGSISARNKIFTDHWAIRGGSLCQGSYAKDLDAAFKRSDSYALFDIIFHFLHSTDDGSAYEGSHKWRDKRNCSQLSSEKPEDWKTGDYAIITSKNADGKALRGYTAKVREVGSRGMELEFRKDMGGHKGSMDTGKAGHCWRVGKNCCTKITKEQYKAEDVYKFKGIDASDAALEKIDQLPDGSTIKDAREIAKEFYENRLAIEFGL